MFSYRGTNGQNHARRNVKKFAVLVERQTTAVFGRIH